MRIYHINTIKITVLIMAVVKIFVFPFLLPFSIHFDHLPLWFPIHDYDHSLCQEIYWRFSHKIDNVKKSIYIESAHISYLHQLPGKESRGEGEVVLSPSYFQLGEQLTRMHLGEQQTDIYLHRSWCDLNWKEGKAVVGEIVLSPPKHQVGEQLRRMQCEGKYSRQPEDWGTLVIEMQNFEKLEIDSWEKLL